MTELPPLDSFFDATGGRELPLPYALADRYGPLRFPTHPDRPHVVANFVATLDGVVTLALPGKAGGRAISGANPHDRMVMGLLRAVADVVIVGAGTFRASSTRRWTADAAYPPLADAFASLRRALDKPEPPLNVVVTASGDLDLDQLTEGVPWLVVTSAEGAGRLRGRPAGATLRVVAAGSGELGAEQILDVVGRTRSGQLVLIEGGPRLMGDFVAERRLDELFLTVAPQIAGRAGAVARPGLVAGKQFAPDDPRWGTVVSLKRAGSHLFLRYALAPADRSSGPCPLAKGETP